LDEGRHELATGIDYSYGEGDTVNNFRAKGDYLLERGRVHRRRARDFYLGRFSSFEQAVGEYRTPGCTSWRRSFQDTFRVNRQLTLNLGLRWDPFIPYTDVNNRLGCYRPGRNPRFT